MRIVFMGTADFACPVLEAITGQAGHETVLVIAQPDRPAGRGRKETPPPVKETAVRLGLPVFQPARIKDPDAQQVIRDAQPDLIVVVAYGQILPQSVLDLPRHGCINVHGSLLPRWRGAAPIQYAIWKGDTVTGVTTMYMNAKMDEGDIILQREEVIRPDDTSESLFPRLAAAGAELAVETIRLITEGRAPRIVQDETTVTYAHKITKEQGRIDWARPAVEMERQIRAFNPWPSAYFFVGELMIKIWRAEVGKGTEAVPPGTVTTDRAIATGEGVLRPVDVQPAGKKRMGWDEFLRGHELPPGSMVG
jgi:methionyl-tRNA formyltransferase